MSGGRERDREGPPWWEIGLFCLAGLLLAFGVLLVYAMIVQVASWS